MNESTENQGLLFGPEPKDGPKWGQQRRLEFIDYRLTWDQVLRRSDLTDFFGISVPQASLDISEYIKRASSNIVYDPKTKIYRSTTEFRSIYPSSNLSRFMEDLLRISSSSEVPYDSFLGWIPSIVRVPTPGRRLDTQTVLAITRAMRENGKLVIRYQSFSEADPVVRTISPHSLANDGSRWHIRAYCHTRLEFRDFLFSRIHDVISFENDRPRKDEDISWNKIVTLELVPHPGLQPNQKRIIELDYAMLNGVHRMDCRQSLIYYVFRNLRLDLDSTSVDPKAQQIILNNYEEIKDKLPKNIIR